MNSYNNNLHNTTVNILNNQKLEVKKNQSALRAGMFTLYYAKGAEITAGEHQKQAATTCSFKEGVVNETNANNHISINVLASAEQEKKLVGQAVSNAATAASNIQISANAITKLASDMGSVLSITQASMLDTEINEQAILCSKLIKETAYLAEEISQYSMEASALTSEVSANTVEAKATVTDTSVNELLAVATQEFDAAKAELKTTTETLNISSYNKNKAEGTLEDLDTNSSATENAYHLSNEKINLNLEVPSKDLSDTSFTICFYFIKAPFETNEKPDYPVEDYYILLVKDSEKSTFSITDAEQLILNKGRYVKVAPAESNETPSVSTTILLTELIDADGDAMQLGQEYTIFVLAVYSEAYKKSLNAFDNFLTAPAATFTLTHTLQHPDATAVDFDPETNTLGFSLTENAAFSVAYRCMYLPCTSADDKPGFLFNLDLAEQVSTGNYSVAATTENPDNGKKLITGTTQLTEATTDNFGNSLVKGQLYLPVVLSISTEVATDLDQFTYALSPFTLTTPFIYHPIGLDKQ